MQTPQYQYREIFEQGTGRLLERIPIEITPEELAELRKEERLAHILDELDTLEDRVKGLEHSVGPVEKTTP